mgnify:CR=1 FL=1
MSSIVPGSVRSEILNPLTWRTGRTAPDSLGSRNLCECQAAAVGPDSDSPSPTTTTEMRSGVSMTEPYATARAYPSLRL